ncbi:30S ribosomal protein S6 [Pirellula sp. SH-Sr6A]|uniref:30S ribosomal protein S6 n=1 Tax=Pirellula sp. SH-Sr6A TaxID=1632865 RepID=UPI00078B55E2|nr:30S ribosomal protein S6 [Pirellula sp. SH-Sr6A]AMV34459.1 30S ribosomal protein S6 [Pirellula sp. SH-Sr6A]
MATGIYECLFLFDSNHYARDPGGVATSVQSMIADLGGEILVCRLWAEQRLAYPINGHNKGTYWLAYFRLDTLKLKELNRTCQLNESLLRFMFTKIDPRLIDALVAHAQEKVVVPIDALERQPVGVGVGADDEEESEVEDE